MSCASRGRTSCCRCGSHPLGLVLGDSCLQGRAGARRWRIWLALWGGALLTSWVFFEDSVLGLSSSTKDTCTYSLSKSVLCPLVYRPGLSYPSPERAAPSRLSPIPRVQVLKAYLSPSFWRHPQTSISRCLCSTRRLTVATLWLSAARGSGYNCASSGPKLTFSAVDSSLVGQTESELGPPRII